MNQACPERSRRDPESILSCPSGTSWLIAPFGNKNMQNKPNLQVAQINVTSLLLTTNDQRLATREAQNKPNFKPKQTQMIRNSWPNTLLFVQNAYLTCLKGLLPKHNKIHQK